MMRIAAWLGLVFAAAAAAAPADAAPDVAASSPFAAAGIWTGMYDCAQGQTSLELDVTIADPQHLQALFYFHAAPANPFVPDGCFLMQGAFDTETSTLSLAPTQWLLQPGGYVSVGLSGVLADDGSLAGSISGPGCSRFSLSRSGPRAQRPAPCKAPDSLGIS